MTRQSEQHLKTLVLERHADVRAKLDNLLNALASNDRDRVLGANNALSESLQALGSVVAQQDWPAWFQDLLQNVERYKAKHSNGVTIWKAHLLAVMRNWPQVESYVWFSEAVAGDEPPFDVDQIVQKARAAHKIDELFSRLIQVLETLADCDELDSVKACEDLDRVIRTLKRAQGGSFTSQIVSWQFARRFIPNLISCYLKRSDITGPAIEAFEQTATELDVAFDKAKDDIGQKVLSVATKGFRSKAIEQITAQEIRALPDLSQPTE